MYVIDSTSFLIDSMLSMLFSGPECWGSCYDTCGSGTQQSPINILESTLESIDFPPIEFIGYDEETDMLLYNDGHSGMTFFLDP